MLCRLSQALTPDVPTSISATTALWANAHKVEHDDQHPSSRCTLQVLPLSRSLPGQPWLLLTENDAPTGRRIHLGGFFRGRTTLCGAVCWGSCRGGRGCPVPNGSRFPNEDESFDKNKKGGGNSETPSPISQAASFFLHWISTPASMELQHPPEVSPSPCFFLFPSTFLSCVLLNTWSTCFCLNPSVLPPMME